MLTIKDPKTGKVLGIVNEDTGEEVFSEAWKNKANPVHPKEQTNTLVPPVEDKASEKVLELIEKSLREHKALLAALAESDKQND